MCAIGAIILSSATTISTVQSVLFYVLCRMFHAPLFPQPHTEHATKHVLKCGTGGWKWILEVQLFPVKRFCDRGNEQLVA